jgi:hypothetical protein
MTTAQRTPSRSIHIPHGLWNDADGVLQSESHVAALIDMHGYDISDNAMSLGHWACEKGHRAWFEEWCRVGNLHAVNGEGYSIGHAIAHSGHADLLDIWHGHGGDIHAVNDYGAPSSSIGHEAMASGSVETLRRWMALGGRPDVVDGHGNSLGHMTPPTDDAACFEAWCDAGGHVHAVNASGASIGYTMAKALHHQRLGAWFRRGGNPLCGVEQHASIGHAMVSTMSFMKASHLSDTHRDAAEQTMATWFEHGGHVGFLVFGPAGNDTRAHGIPGHGFRLTRSHADDLRTFVTYMPPSPYRSVSLAYLSFVLGDEPSPGSCGRAFRDALHTDEGIAMAHAMIPYIEDPLRCVQWASTITRPSA